MPHSHQGLLFRQWLCLAELEWGSGQRQTSLKKGFAGDRVVGAGTAVLRPRQVSVLDVELASVQVVSQFSWTALIGASVVNRSRRGGMPVKYVPCLVPHSVPGFPKALAFYQPANPSIAGPLRVIAGQVPEMSSPAAAPA